MDIPIRTQVPVHQDLENFQVFLGAPDSPFLAPRGVWMGEDKLIVADTAQNRVFIWNALPTTPQAEPDVVLGQAQSTQTGRNAGGPATASTFHYPSGIWSNGELLMVADAWNHRTLIWTTFPTHHAQPADLVLGQPDFHGCEPNVGGITARPSAQSLNWPYGLWSNGEELWIADTGNRRILYFDSIPQQSFAPADLVLGQEDFQTRDYDSDHPVWPYAVKIGPHGELAVPDTQFFRVLLWSHWKDALDQPPSAIIGQRNLKENGQNQFRWKPGPNTMNWTYDAHFHEKGLWAVDTGNSRLLWFPSIPDEPDCEAEAVLGQPDFSTGSENAQTIQGTESTMYWPFAISIHGQKMAIADTGNHRILFTDL
ncbi:MAG: hypothetical protein AAF804_06595 [Bacteroidota bacterium]